MRVFETKAFAYKPIPSLMDANSEIGGHEVACPNKTKKTPLFPPNNLEKENKILYITNIYIYLIIYTSQL